jgi:8-oxo-dGTP pyrophosphatase MutT (NUDIX family)
MQPTMSTTPQRHTRYQGAVVQNGRLLLLEHTEHASGQAYWLFPGGGIEAGESEAECVVRELFEETGLVVDVGRLLIHDVLPPGDFYAERKTYLCHVVSGVAAPGYDLEPFAAASYGITNLLWIALDQLETWSAAVTSNERLMPQLRQLVAALGAA